ncbi:MAG: metal-dependent transcriptional regulator, partial [Lactococcus lactis]|nr:metal-dependent transcriptional regulator [Lactococcus lactis]
PHGSEIPTESFWLKNEVELTLDEAQVDQTYHVTTIEEEGKNFFKKLEISLPHLIKVIDKLEDKSIIIKEDRESSIVIPPFLQSKIHLMHRR